MQLLEMAGIVKNRPIVSRTEGEMGIALEWRVRQHGPMVFFLFKNENSELKVMISFKINQTPFEI